MNRRTFLKRTALIGAGVVAAPLAVAKMVEPARAFNSGRFVMSRDQWDILTARSDPPMTATEVRASQKRMNEYWTAQVEAFRKVQDKLLIEHLESLIS